MIVLESIGIALIQLWAHKLRSVLTLLGMLIGVGAVVGIVSISEGMRRWVSGQFLQMGGANLIVVMPQEWAHRDGRWVRVRDYVPMTLDDVAIIAASSDRVSMVVPLLTTGTLVRHGKATYEAELTATTPHHEAMFNWRTERGRFLLHRDQAELRRVCVLGRTAADEVFGGADPVGQEIKLDGQRFEVVGLMADRQIFGDDWGNQVLVPVTTAHQRIFGHDRINGAYAYLVSPEDAPVVIDQIQTALKRVHGSRAEYRIESGRGFLDQIEGVFLVMKLVTGGIAGISLLVGGIGIMNIMLVSVTERTREIGIRKALGAKPAVLMLQFVVEAIVLSLCGGLLGLGTGVGLGLGISHVIAQYSEVPYPSVVSYSSALLSLGLALAVGLFFGIYPAVRAARLNPVDALGYE